MAKIIAKNLVKKFNSKIVLKNISFHITNGLFAYIGPNGSGKTTTVRLCLKIIKPSSGEIQILQDDGTPVRQKRIGFLLENETPFENFTPVEYLKFYAEVYGIANEEQKIDEWLEMLSLASRKGEKIAMFSKGMKRKLCLIKSLLGNPDVLFLDEPLEGIEIEVRREIKNMLLELKKTKVVFLTTHNLAEIESICDTFGIIVNGTFAGRWERNVLTGSTLEDFYFLIKGKLLNAHTD